MNREIWRVVLISLFSVIFGFSLGAPFEILVAGLVIYSLWTFRVISQLFSWIDKGMRGFPPDTDGVWGEISDTLNRQRRRHRRNQAQRSGARRQVLQHMYNMGEQCPCAYHQVYI